MAKIPKAATSGGKAKRAGASFVRSAGGSRVSVPTDRGGRRIGPTHCSANGRHTYAR